MNESDNHKADMSEDLSFGFTDQDRWTEEHSLSHNNRPVGNRAESYGAENRTEKPQSEDRNSAFYEAKSFHMQTESSGKRKKPKNPLTPPQAKALFLIWLLLSTLICAVPVGFKEFWVIIFYALQLGTGAIVQLSSLAENKRKNMLRFIVGEAIAAAVLVTARLIVPEVFAKLSDGILVVQLTGILPFALIGAVLTVFSVLQTGRKKQRCTQPVQARCVDLLEDESYDNESGATTTVYCPVYEYYFNGRLYRSNDNQYSNLNVPEIYGVYEILLNPEDPEELYDPKRVKTSAFIMTVIGGGFLFMGGLGFVLILMSAFGA